MLRKIESVDIITSAICNLKCSYCIIDQDIVDHERVVEWSGNVIEDISKFPIEKVKNLSIWGCEPALTLLEFEQPLLELIDKGLERISISSNFSNVDPFIHFIELLISKKSKVSLSLQVSIDGPDELTGQSRGISTDKIIGNVNKLVDYIKNKPIKVDMHQKATWSAIELEKIARDLNLLKEYYGSVAELSEIFNKLYKKPDKTYYTCPTFSLPYNFTVSDGHNLDIVMGESIKMKEANPNVMVLFERELFSLFKYRLPFVGKCSAGSSMVCFSPGSVGTCQDILLKGYLTPYIKFPFKISKPEDMIYLRYVAEGSASFDKFRFRNIQVLINELAMSGQIRSEYLNKEKALVFAYLIANTVVCYVKRLAKGSMFMTDTGIIRLLGQLNLFSLLRRLKNVGK